MTQALVLHDGRVADTLVLAEDTVGKDVLLPANFEGSVREVVQLDIVCRELF